MKLSKLISALLVSAMFIPAAAHADQVKIALGSVDQAFLDNAETLKRAEAAMKEASANGAKLIAFSEGFYGGGYPIWSFVSPAMDFPGVQENYRKLWNVAITRDGKEMKALQVLAKKYNIAVVMPFNERGQGHEYKAIYNSAAMIEQDGTLKHVERKTIASHNEKMYWTQADDPGVQVIELAGIRVAYNACWQNYLPAIRHAQYMQGAQLVIASTADFGPAWTRLMQTIGDEGNVYVASIGQMYRWDDVAKADPKVAELAKRTFKEVFNMVPPKLWSSDALFINPEGNIVAQSKTFESKVVYGVVDTEAAAKKSVYRDVTTNYKLPLEIYYNGKKISPDHSAENVVSK